MIILSLSAVALVALMLLERNQNKVKWSAIALELFDGMLCEINIFLAAFMVVQVPGVSLSSSACGSKAFSKCLVYSLTDHWNSPYRWKRTARPGKPQSEPTAAHREMERMTLVLNYWCFLYFLDVVVHVTSHCTLGKKICWEMASWISWVYQQG